MKTRVLLINSPTMGDQSIGIDNYFPLGLLYLASVLEEDQIAEVKIVDVSNHFFLRAKSNRGWEQTGGERRPRNNHLFVNEASLDEYFQDHLCSCIKEFKPDIVGIGATFSGSFQALKIIAQKVKQSFPKIQIITGGITSSMFPREILEKYEYIDYVTIGEGEETLAGFVKCFHTGSSLSRIEGLAYRAGDRIVLNAKTHYIQDLDKIPFPNYKLLDDLAEYDMDTSGWYSPKGLVVGQPFPILTSRSCPNKCTFCNMFLVHGRGIRYRSPENVLDEMEFLHNEYGVTYFHFIDDNLTYDNGRVLEICDGILERKMDIHFDTPNGVAVSRLSEEVVDAMVDAGLACVSLPIESGSEFIRNKAMKKGLNDEKIYETVKALAKHTHVLIRGLFIIGMPEETQETLEETFSMIRELPLDKVDMFYATPYPGTELLDFCREHNLLEHDAKEMLDIVDLQHEAYMPHFKPFKLEKEDLVAFKKKCRDYMISIRKERGGDLPNNYPLRFDGFKHHDRQAAGKQGSP